jgi:hypothetical protein
VTPRNKSQFLFRKLSLKLSAMPLLWLAVQLSHTKSLVALLEMMMSTSKLSLPVFVTLIFIKHVKISVQPLSQWFLVTKLLVLSLLWARMSPALKLETTLVLVASLTHAALALTAKARRKTTARQAWLAHTTTATSTPTALVTILRPRLVQSLMVVTLKILLLTRTTPLRSLRIFHLNVLHHFFVLVSLSTHP